MYRNLRRFSKGKGRVLHPGRSNPKCQHRLGVTLESSSAEKGLGVLVDDKLSLSQQSVLGPGGQWDPGGHLGRVWPAGQGMNLPLTRLQ